MTYFGQEGRVSVKAYVKREREQAQLLEGVWGEMWGGAEWPCYHDALMRTFYFLLAVSKYREAKGIMNKVLIPTEMTVGVTHALRAIERIDWFARTPAEGMHLMKRLLERLLQASFRFDEAEYLRDRNHKQEQLYSGHKAEDEVDP